MARVQSDAPPPKRRRLPKAPTLDWSVAVTTGFVIVLANIVAAAPSEWLRFIAMAVTFVVVYRVGYLDGRRDLSTELLRDLRRDDRGA